MRMYLTISGVKVITLTQILFWRGSPKNFLKNIIISMILSLFCSVVVLYEVAFLNSFCIVELNSWFKLGLLNVEWCFFFDKVSAFLLFLVVFISLLVHFFALDYLNGDPHLSRFMMLLFLFTTFMEILVTSGNLIQFFLGWEGVGLMSYLLINFWFTRFAATNSGLMAIIYNRVGDTGLLLGVALISFILKTTDFVCLFAIVKFASSLQINVFCSYFNFFDFLTILLFLGVIGKSAQIFLESWLSSAMEGPTPVSSLLHASTMIVSGVFLLQRFQPYILCSLSGMVMVTFVGALTAFFAGTIGLVTMDLKRVIAYSTCSQMGYLVFCFGIGNSSVSLFHLCNHAFFKCVLFVAAGTLIHALLNEQDIRKMGGLFKLFPFVFVLILFASLSLMGMPFLSGFYSKEKILEYSFYIYNNSNIFAFWLGSLSAFLTSIYSMRLIFIVFFNSPNNYKNQYILIHTNVKYYLNVVLIILGLGAIISGFIFEDIMTGLGSDFLMFTNINSSMMPLIFLGYVHVNSIALFYSYHAIFVSYLCFMIDTKGLNLLFFSLYKEKNNKFFFVKSIYNFLGKRWYLNLMYNKYIVLSSFYFGYAQTFILLDKGFFEFISLISARKFGKLSEKLSFNFYRTYYLGEIFIYFFIIYSLMCMIFNFELQQYLFTGNAGFFLLLKNAHDSYMSQWAVPRKKNRSSFLPVQNSVALSTSPTPKMFRVSSGIISRDMSSRLFKKYSNLKKKTNIEV